MNKFSKKSKIFLAAVALISISLFFLWPSQQSNTLYLIYDGTKAGEKNQVLGIANALTGLLPANTTRKEFDLKDQAAFISDIQQNIKKSSPNRGIVLAAEVASVDVLRKCNPQPNIVISHSSHQFTKDHAGLRDVADIIALPKYVVTDEIFKEIESPHTILIQTAGVPHNLSPKVIALAYESNKGRVPHKQDFIGIILGGDAETPDKKLRYYTTEEAAQIADFIGPQMKEKKAHLLILNGPRTGKHDQKTGKVIETSHRDGNTDVITTAFIESLQKQGFIQGEDFTLFDFQFGKPSMYPVVLGALLKTKSPIFVAGESTSMVSETADCLSSGLVTAYINNAMNENHMNHCDSENEAGRINILKKQGDSWQLLKARDISDFKDRRPASKIIAEAIKKRFEEKSQESAHSATS